MKNNKKISLRLGLALACAVPAMLAGTSASAQGPHLREDDAALKQLGKFVFYDENLSNPIGQSCASCHDAAVGGVHPDSATHAGQVGAFGADGVSIGGRKPPSNTYASFSPEVHVCNTGGPGGLRYCGGNFWDGRSLGTPNPITATVDNPDCPPGPPGSCTLPPVETEVVFDFPAPHLGAEVFHDIYDPKVLGYVNYIGPTSDQALNPMPNPVEQNISRQEVCMRVASASYAWVYRRAWGKPINCSSDVAFGDELEYDISFKRLMLAVGAYQHSGDINSFTSRRDFALRVELACVDSEYSRYYSRWLCRHIARDIENNDAKDDYGQFPLTFLSDAENLGHDLFYNVSLPFIPAPPQFPDLPAANCSFCHSSPRADGTPDNDGTDPLQTYTDNSYHNIGTPFNRELPPVSPGSDSGAHELLLARDEGFFRTPTARNSGKVPAGMTYGEDFIKSYAHNGWFKSLESLVHFYNTRATKAACEDLGIEQATEAEALANDCWPTPEFPATASPPFLVGALGMSPEQEAAIVAYLHTLTDLHTARAPRIR